MDNIIEEINVQENNNNNADKREDADAMSVMTGSGSMDWEYNLDLDHVIKLNQIPHTYNTRLRKKLNTLIKIKPDMDYVKKYANDLIKRNFCVHVLKDEPSSLSAIPESAPASKASASATIQVNNTSPAAKEEKEPPLIADSAILEPSVAETMMDRMKATEEAQARTNEVTVTAMHGIVNAISNMSNTGKADKSFERLILKLLLEQKFTDFSEIPVS